MIRTAIDQRSDDWTDAQQIELGSPMALSEARVVFGGLHLGGGIGAGVRVAKEFGLTGIPVTHVENASATARCT